LFLGEIGAGQTSRMRMRALERPRSARRAHDRTVDENVVTDGADTRTFEIPASGSLLRRR
jgi:hypothetical protein